MKIGSSSCLRSTTSIGLCKFQVMIFEFLNVRDSARKISVGTSVLVRKTTVLNAKLQTWKIVKFYGRCHGWQGPRQRISVLQRFPVRWIGDSWKRWDMYDAPQCGSFECSSFISHNEFCKGAQYLPSNQGLVWWIDSADSWSINHQHGEIQCESDWTVKSKIGAWGGENVGTDTSDECMKQREIDCVSTMRNSNFFF